MGRKKLNAPQKAKEFVEADFLAALAVCGPSVSLISQHLGSKAVRINRALREEPNFQAEFDEWVLAVLDYMRTVGANESIVARFFDVPRHYVSAWIREVPRLRIAATDYRETFVDLAEYGILRALQNEAPWAIQYTLRTQGSERGWGENLRVNLEDESRRLGINLSGVVRELADAMAKQPALEDGEDIVDGDYTISDDA